MYIDNQMAKHIIRMMDTHTHIHTHTHTLYIDIHTYIAVSVVEVGSKYQFLCFNF